VAKILILDEEADSCMLLKRLLERGKHSLWAFMKPADALRCATVESPDLAVVSVTSRRGANMEIIAELKQARPGLKVMVIADYVPDAGVWNLSADAFLVKPLDIDAVELKVRELLFPMSSDAPEGCAVQESSKK